MSYDWKKTLSKFGVQAVFVIIAGVAAVYGDTPLYLAIAPLLTAVQNWFKHKGD